MTNLGELRQKQQRYEEAESFHAAVLRITRRKPDSGDFDLLPALGNLASLYEDWGRWEEAAVLREEAAAVTAHGSPED